MMYLQIEVNKVTIYKSGGNFLKIVLSKHISHNLDCIVQHVVLLEFQS